MDGFEKLHNDQDEFIKKVLQEDKLISQPVFESFSTYIDQSNIKVKRYSYKQQKIIFILVLLLVVSVGYNIYLTFIKEPADPIETETSSPTKNPVLEIDENLLNQSSQEKNTSNNLDDFYVTIDDDTTNTTNTIANELANTAVINTTIAPAIFTDIDTKEVTEFVNDFAIGINRLSLDQETLESNTILLYMAQQYFVSKSTNNSSLAVNTTYASTAENFHKFLSELTIKDYSTVTSIDSYNNYIGYTPKSKSYTYGSDYSELSKETYNCTSVTITDKTNGIYTAKATVTKESESGTSTYEIVFTFKVNNNYKYQKYKLLSLSAKNTSDIVDTTLHLVNE